jgi:ParB/RepB/Spo0J family partition protein
MPFKPNYSHQFQTVPLTRIDLQNERYRITTREDVDDLIPSIQTSGLISPPSIIESNDGYIIVSGFRRIAACQTLKISEIAVRTLATDTDEADCLRIAIADNALQRSLNLIETSRALKKISEISTDLQQVAEIAASCGLPSNTGIIRKIKDLCLLPESVQRGVVDEIIPLAIAGELIHLPDDVAIDVTRLFVALKLSLNKQREILTLATEIARRENISLRRLLSSEKLMQLANDDELDRSQKTRQIRAFLRQRRFPRIVEAERHFNQLIKNLKLGRDFKLVPPKDFEGNQYSLVITFRNRPDLISHRTTIDRLLEHPGFTEIIED